MDIYSNQNPIATVEQFKTALKAVKNRVGIIGKSLDMLSAHYRAPNHTISSTGLAKELGWASFSSVNLRYGNLARDVAEELRIKLPPTPSGDPHWWRTLAYGNDGMPQADDGCYEWIMRPELVQALEELKWVRA